MFFGRLFAYSLVCLGLIWDEGLEDISAFAQGQSDTSSFSSSKSRKKSFPRSSILILQIQLMRTIPAGSSILGILEGCSKATLVLESQRGLYENRHFCHAWTSQTQVKACVILAKLRSYQTAHTAAKGRPIQLRMAARSDIS